MRGGQFAARMVDGRMQIQLDPQDVAAVPHAAPDCARQGKNEVAARSIRRKRFEKELPDEDAEAIEARVDESMAAYRPHRQADCS